MTRAVYWINYILRHRGASHLRSAVYEVSPYQYFLLDVLLCVGAVLALLGLSLRQILRLLCARFWGQSHASRDASFLSNGHCHSESVANGKHRGNGLLKNEKKRN